MTAASGAGNQQVIVERLDDIRCDVAGLVVKVDTLASSYQTFREDYIQRHSAVVSETARAHQRLDRVEAEVRELRALATQQAAQYAELAHNVRLMVRILGAIASGIGIWLLSQLLGLL